MKVVKGKIIHGFSRLVLSSLFFFPMKVTGSEQSHATFKVENVGPLEQSGNQIPGSLPATNDLINVNLILLGALLLLLSFVLLQFKKGTLYEK